MTVIVDCSNDLDLSHLERGSTAPDDEITSTALDTRHDEYYS